ncbi:hypothetical protein DPM19_28300 [Actinomadura craniellae]|uniref:RNA polymerase sigma-70 region 2 domain-containing protein n=1 Tax=Actinomadura craniellae TaxID=2231787 RepID=A0A365GYI6_9ACTN|nr:sigma-70 family RNA polymerase sigma factor [Actinomadura craniellae]RAY11876.1 hypothetical protein DPM19_28300 [Actinomadura craniellae]
MSGWPNSGPDDDRRLASSLQSGDPDALAHAFDGYAPRLYDYCHALLRDQETAARALHDALIAAHQHVHGLTEPEYLRGWLYAMARNECMRRLRDPNRPAERRESPEIEGPAADAEERARRQEARQLVHSALAGLGGRQREAIDLLFRHGLDPQEIGGVLGMPGPDADALTRQARHDLDQALAAALLAREAPGSPCPSVGPLLGDGRWPLAPATCRKLIRHIETCSICAEQRHRPLSAGPLLQALPTAMMPADLRAQVLTAAFAPDLAEMRARIARRAEPFDEWGWPVPVDPRTRRTEPAAGGGGKGRNLVWPAAAAAVTVLLLVGGVFFVLSGSSGSSPSGDPSSQAAAPDPSEPAEEPSVEPSELPTPTPTRTTASPSPTPTPTRTTSSPTPRRPQTPVGQVRVFGCNIPGGAELCMVSVAVTGGRAAWSVVGASSGLQVGRQGGTSSGGVPVRRPACTEPGDFSGSVQISPGGSAPVSWTCPDDEPPSPPAGTP